MDTDLALVLGLLLAFLAIPSLLSAASDRRTPRVSAVFLVLAVGLLLYAFSTKSGGYQIDDIPKAIFRVIGRFT
ncbi:MULTISPECIES: hypothetical protein [Phaeobacter]|uniref:Uncharacterized protein n=1 Tax=Phaeobacter inhibens TaxID=221822 RepID=A0A135IJC1_9RHOB|nr:MULTISPECIES: hypothetical protein [Phaeobacter]APX17066.1 hypothetical protein BWR17_15315 [Phaeobacter inhibens]AUQ53386.1 hypothetical protein PhaeoP92_00683 [Phaeobacter inhibens]AUQ57616.1 hypothetical protein PhaeoP30_00674 [Phaeobacter inhibens]AUQ61657.1 hypothetical protein PhaeoP51_00640 [Phaeobacter inhibens]AUQ67400.1 hypothetical protein PhaeoP78_02558 [Phaeobacter inhibens]